LRDLRGVLHQGLNGQAAANGINALLDTEVIAPAGARVAGWCRRLFLTRWRLPIPVGGGGRMRG